MPTARERGKFAPAVFRGNQHCWARAVSGRYQQKIFRNTTAITTKAVLWPARRKRLGSRDKACCATTGTYFACELYVPGEYFVKRYFDDPVQGGWPCRSVSARSLRTATSRVGARPLTLQPNCWRFIYPATLRAQISTATASGREWTPSSTRPASPSPGLEPQLLVQGRAGGDLTCATTTRSLGAFQCCP